MLNYNASFIRPRGRLIVGAVGKGEVRLGRGGGGVKTGVKNFGEEKFKHLFFRLRFLPLNFQFSTVLHTLNIHLQIPENANLIT